MQTKQATVVPPQTNTKAPAFKTAASTPIPRNVKTKTQDHIRAQKNARRHDGTVRFALALSPTPVPL